MSHPHQRNQAWKRRLAIVSRWLHIYISMAAFGILLFFAVTGITLNHQDWFSEDGRTTEIKGTLDKKWLGKEVAKLDVVEFLRRAHGIKGAMGEFRVEDDQCTVTFKGPGYSANAFIDRASGKYDLTENRAGFVAAMNDLHKGRDSGRVWSVAIDVSAVLMTLVSLSGFTLIFFLQKRRLSGLVVTGIGAAAFWVVYRIFAPV